MFFFREKTPGDLQTPLRIIVYFLQIDADRMIDYIFQEMAEYQKELKSMIQDIKAIRNSKKVSASDMEKIKKIYYKLVRKIHPDMRPDLADDEKIKEYWQRIVIAYTYNQLKELEQLDVMVMAYLQSEGLEVVDLELDDLDDRIAETEEEIKNIISTNPYLYKQLLQDEEQTLRRKQEYQDEIASYEIYSAQLDEVLATFDIERKLS